MVTNEHCSFASFVFYAVVYTDMLSDVYNKIHIFVLVTMKDHFPFNKTQDFHLRATVSSQVNG